MLFATFLFFIDLVVKERWRELTDDVRKMHILRLLNATDVSDRNKRMAAVRSILYLAQGEYRLCNDID